MGQPMKQLDTEAAVAHPWLYQNEACPFMQGCPGCVALTQPVPCAVGLCARE